MASIDLNCDIGEELDDQLDAALFPLITSASIACGGHAGGPESMLRSVDRALTHGVAIGAHVSYPDREGFGRSALPMSPSELTGIISMQIDALRSVCARAGGVLSYVKPHGALYHAVGADPEFADALITAADSCLRIVGMPGSALEVALDVHPSEGRFVREGFPERGYSRADMLQPRDQPGALIHDPQDVAARAIALATHAPFAAVEGTLISTRVDTLCIHSDHPNALANAMAIRVALGDAGVDVRAFV